MVRIQGGDPEFVDNPDKLPKARTSYCLKSKQRGYVTAINAEKIGIAAMLLGAGRKTKDDMIDFAAGITIMKKTGDRVEAGDTLCILHTNKDDFEDAKYLAESAFSFGNEGIAKRKYVYEVIE